VTRALLVAFALGALACQTAKTTAYDAEYQRLEQQAQQQRQMDEAEHAQAQKFAAVIYFETGSGSRRRRAAAAAGSRTRWGSYPLATFDVQGFADATGGDAHNAALSGSARRRCRRTSVARHRGAAHPRARLLDRLAGRLERHRGGAEEQPARRDHRPLGRA
jgi:hypothetical protein